MKGSGWVRKVNGFGWWITKRVGRGGGGDKKNGPHHGRPYARDGHPAGPVLPRPHEALPLEVHRQPDGQHAHADLAHGVGGLAAEEAAVDGRADDEDAAGAALLQVRQGDLQGGVQPLDVDGLHQAEAPHGRVLDRGPPDGAGVVDEGV